ncbi:PIN domain-containing protein [Flavobacterium beibuense]|uniref:DUF4935 domain-containing protein n=1 Tax=Flavobacterium beibuense TaxID=657326 RepID=A0A444WI65_9FLAO|nr:PIN domain-containing protein [Flavobacterium beibuense]RYJ45442.1 hypothetical protein NU09_0034 [Flavobacterium beibuense]
MIYLILDTNIWIYLANGFNSMTNGLNSHSTTHFELYEKLKQKVDDREFIILTNYIIKLEWERSKKCAKKNVSELERLKKEDLFLLVKQKETIENDVFKRQFEKVSNYYKQLIESNNNHINNINNFIKSCTEIPVSDRVKLEIVDRAIRKDKAPFLNNKNNFPDAAILFSAAEYLKRNMVPLSCAVFVSSNYKEFGNASDLPGFHSDLKDFLNEINIEYHKHLADLLELTEDLQYNLEVFYEHLREQEYYFNCRSPYCEMENEYGSFGYLESEVRIAYNSEEIDNNQYNLFEGLDIERNHRVKIVWEGKCITCKTNHVECPGCKSLLMDVNDDNQYFCKGCDQGYKITTSSKYKDKIIYHINEDEFHL